MDKKLKACFLTSFEIEKEDLIQNNITTDTIDCFMRKPKPSVRFHQENGSLLEAI
jgi:hypothetical protein